MKGSSAIGEMQRGFRRRNNHFQVTQGGKIRFEHAEVVTEKLRSKGVEEGKGGLGLTVVKSEGKERRGGLGELWGY